MTVRAVITRPPTPILSDSVFDRSIPARSAIHPAKGSVLFVEDPTSCCSGIQVCRFGIVPALPNPRWRVRRFLGSSRRTRRACAVVDQHRVIPSEDEISVDAIDGEIVNAAYLCALDYALDRNGLAVGEK